MITRTAKLQVLVFVLVSVLGISYVAVNYLGVGERLVGRGYTVNVDLAQAGGLFENAAVTYRGVPVGKVGSVRLSTAGVRAELHLDGDVRVPADLRAVVAQRSAVGEQYLDLRPNTDTGPYLRDGSVIPVDRTGVPLPVETLLGNLDALVESVGRDDLRIVIDELGRAFEGNERALRLLLDASNALLTDATRDLPNTVALIRDGRTVLTTQVESADAIRRWAAGLAQLAATMRQADPDLRRLIAAGPPAATELVGLLHDLDPTIGTLLGNLVTVNGIATRRLAGIEQTLVVFPIVVQGGFTVAPGDGTAHLGLVVNIDDPPACTYGEGPCGGPTLVRGARNAPRPGGSEARPAPDGGTAPPEAGSGPESSAAVAGYDPATGLVVGPDGRPLTFGATGGQYQLAGDQSWKQLLLAGLAP